MSAEHRRTRLDPAHDPHPELPVDPDVVGEPHPHHRLGLLLVVAAGGSIGAVLRYALANAVPAHHDAWPTATLLTNLLGALLLGVLLEALARTGPDAGGRRVLRLGLGTGLLGAFTTYSALATEAVLLGRDGHVGLGLSYGLTSAVGGYLAAAVGIWIAALGHRTVTT